MTKRERTVTTWVVLLALFVALYVWPDLVGHALVGAAIGLAGMFGLVTFGKLVMQMARRSGRRGKRAVGTVLGLCALPTLLATWIASHLGLGGVVGSVAVYLMLVPFAWRAWRARRCLRALARTLEANGDPARAIAEIEEHRTTDYLAALPLLLRYHRADLVLRLAPGGEWQHAAELDHAAALIDLARLPEARAKLDGLAGRAKNAATAEHLALLGARLAIAEGTPPTGLAEAPRQPDLRLEVLADLYAARGDRDASRRELTALRRRGGEGVLRSLAGSVRPSAPVAAELLAGTTSAPYR